jgi:glycosyltransferase involved in cell wall biosynthesis
MSGEQAGELAELGGLRVEPEDAPAFAAALRRLLQESELRQTKGQAARLLAEERYGHDAVLDRFEADLQRLTDGYVGKNEPR